MYIDTHIKKTLQALDLLQKETKQTDSSSCADWNGFADSLTAVKILNNRKRDLNTIIRAISDASYRLTQRPNIN